MEASQTGRYKLVRFSRAIWQVAHARNLSLSLRAPGLHGEARALAEWHDGPDVVVLFEGKRWPVIRKGRQVPETRALVDSAAHPT